MKGGVERECQKRMVPPWNHIRGCNTTPIECKFRIKTVVLLFACLGTGIFLGSLHYDIHPQNPAKFSCPPEREPSNQEDEKVRDSGSRKANLQHGMSDEELLWEASLVHRRQAVPPQHRGKLLPKVAFMFLTRGPLPLAPLWDCFFATYDQLYSVYVHADPSYVPDVAPSSVFYLRNVPSQV